MSVVGVFMKHKIPHQRRPQTDSSVFGLFGERHTMAVKPFSQMLLIELFSAFAYSPPKCVILADKTEVLRHLSRVCGRLTLLAISSKKSKSSCQITKFW